MSFPPRKYIFAIKKAALPQSAIGLTQRAAHYLNIIARSLKKRKEKF